MPVPKWGLLDHLPWNLRSSSRPCASSESSRDKKIVHMWLSMWGRGRAFAVPRGICTACRHLCWMMTFESSQDCSFMFNSDCHHENSVFALQSSNRCIVLNPLFTLINTEMKFIYFDCLIRWQRSHCHQPCKTSQWGQDRSVRKGIKNRVWKHLALLRLPADSKKWRPTDFFFFYTWSGAWNKLIPLIVLLSIYIPNKSSTGKLFPSQNPHCQPILFPLSLPDPAHVVAAVAPGCPSPIGRPQNQRHPRQASPRLPRFKPTPCTIIATQRVGEGSSVVATGATGSCAAAAAAAREGEGGRRRWTTTARAWSAAGLLLGSSAATWRQGGRWLRSVSGSGSGPWSGAPARTESGRQFPDHIDHGLVHGAG